MIGERRYNTVETSHDIFTWLTVDSCPGDYVKCTIRAPHSQLDTVTDKELPIYLKHIPHAENYYRAQSEDRVYKTDAKFSLNGVSFAVDVVIHVIGYELYPATILVSKDGNDEAIRLQLFE